MELEIKVYGLLSCPHCKATREFLKERGVEFETVFVDLLTGDEKSEALKELRGCQKSHLELRRRTIKPIMAT